MNNELTRQPVRLHLGRILLNLALIDCLVGVCGYVYFNVLHAGDVHAAATPMGSAALTLMWGSWWLSVASLGVALAAAFSDGSRELRTAIMVNAVYVLPLALLLVTRHWNIGERM